MERKLLSGMRLPEGAEPFGMLLGRNAHPVPPIPPVAPATANGSQETATPKTNVKTNVVFEQQQTAAGAEVDPSQRKIAAPPGLPEPEPEHAPKAGFIAAPAHVAP